jgi:hypothetical protein
MFKRQKETKETIPDGLNLLVSLLERVKALEEAQAVHENRLNNLNIPVESVNAISVQTLRMLGQMLLAVTEPQKQAEPKQETPAQEAPKEATP